MFVKRRQRRCYTILFKFFEVLLFPFAMLLGQNDWLKQESLKQVMKGKWSRNLEFFAQKWSKTALRVFGSLQTILIWKYFFLIFIAILRPLRSGIHWPINFTQKINVSVYFQKKSDKFFWDPSFLFSFALFLNENIQNHNFFWKIWLVNEFRTAMGRGCLGI